MADGKRTYIAIDLKSFYASVECVARGLDPLTAHLVVADPTRTEKTICLAVSPALKAYGISGRARLFEVLERLREVNIGREKDYGAPLAGESTDAKDLLEHPENAVGFITAPPRMAEYVACSTRIYQTYLKYVSKEDVLVYSIDEVFIDATDYINLYKVTAHELAMTMMKDVLRETGVTATCGIGTNMYLCKIAMDIVAKHMEPDEDGVRIASIDEHDYRELLWDHEPITDFWRVGHGIAARLAQYGIHTMGDIALCSAGLLPGGVNEKTLYDLFGVNAELLIDHAWGYEPCTMSDARSYRPQTSSLSSGQVLKEPYEWKKARLIVKEMTDLLALDLVDKGLVTDKIVLTICYDNENLSDPKKAALYKGPVTRDYYGRAVPQHAHGTENLEFKTSSSKMLVAAAMRLYDRITDKNLTVRRINIAAMLLETEDHEGESSSSAGFTQIDMFTDYATIEQEKKNREEELQKEKQVQQTILDLKKRFGKNAVIKGMNLEEGSTAIERNGQIGGHKA
ncbi:MAG: DNA methylase [Clostridiales bacterium]|nr:DNA methylase [Clostridiales bacterium]